MRRCFWIALGCWLCLHGVVKAESVGLHFSRAAGAERCIAPGALAHKVEALAARPLAAPAGAEITLEAIVEPQEGGGYRARLHRVASDGKQAATRTVTSRDGSCRELSDLLAFIVALTLNPSLSIDGLPPELLAAFASEAPPEEQLLAELPEVPSEPARPITPPPEVEPRPTPVKPTATARPKERAALAIGLFGAALVRSLPASAPGAELAVMVDLPRLFPLGLSVRSFAPSRPVSLADESADQTTRQARYRANEAALSICPLGFAFGPVRVRGCGGLSLGRLIARGESFDRDRTARLWDSSVLLTFAVWLRLGRGFGLWAGASGRLRMQTTTFELRESDGSRLMVARPGRWGLGFSLGPTYEF